jgi:hypothetical protein
MDGKELLNFYISKRDYSESPEDDYAQTLRTIDLQINPDDREKFFQLLEKAEKVNKKIGVIDISKGGTVFRNELSFSDLILI